MCERKRDSVSSKKKKIYIWVSGVLLFNCYHIFQNPRNRDVDLSVYFNNIYTFCVALKSLYLA